MRIETIIVGQMQTNCYLVWNEKIKKGFLTDPGEQADKIICQCDRFQVVPEAILLTHGHFDHIMAAYKIKEHFNIPIYAGIHEQTLLANANDNLSAMWAEPFTIKADIFLQDNDSIDIASAKIKVIETPGHTQGGVCYYLEEDNILLSGDTLFCESYGRTDFPGGSTSKLMNSIRAKLLTLPPDTDVYPGHGQSTTIGYEKQYNPAAY